MGCLLSLSSGDYDSCTKFIFSKISTVHITSSGDLDSYLGREVSAFCLGMIE